MGVATEDAESPPKKKRKPAQKKKEGTSMSRTPAKKQTPAAKKRAPATKKKASKGAEGKTDTRDSGEKTKPTKERYIRPQYKGDEGPPEEVPTPKDVKRKVIIEYSTDEEASEALIDQAKEKGEYGGFNMHKLKRIRKEVKLTLPLNSKVTTYLHWGSHPPEASVETPLATPAPATEGPTTALVLEASSLEDYLTRRDLLAVDATHEEQLVQPPPS